MRRRVEAYLDGFATTPAEARAVRAHLDECWWCSGEAESLRLIKCSLRRLVARQPADLRAARLRRWADTHQRCAG